MGAEKEARETTLVRNLISDWPAKAERPKKGKQKIVANNGILGDGRHKRTFEQF